jgi:hypothetical protein
MQKSGKTFSIVFSANKNRLASLVGSKQSSNLSGPKFKLVFPFFIQKLKIFLSKQ